MSGTDTIEKKAAVARAGASGTDAVAKAPSGKGVAPREGQQVAAPADTVVVEAPPPETGRRRRGPSAMTISFLVLVLAPFLVFLVYIAAIASDQYDAEARFAVRSLASADADEQVAPGQASVLSTSSMTQDAYVVQSFIQSSEVVRRISQTVDVRAFFTSEKIDWYSRLPADASQEDFLEYWHGQVSTYVDGPSGILILRVRAFEPETAQLLAQLISDESEKLINELSERARSDFVKRAGEEVTRTEALYRKSLTDMNELQNRTGVLDPRAQAGETGTLLTGLMTEKLSIDSRLFVLRQSLDPSSPAVKQLMDFQTSIQAQIDRLRGELAATQTKDDNLSRLLTQFAELETERMVAAGLYEAAKRNLSHAQAEAIRQSAYLSVFVTPDLPEESRYPRRYVWPLMCLVALMAVWATLMLGWASVQDHRI